MRLLGAIPAVLLAVLLGQGQGRPAARRPRGRADGGPIVLGTDPPGRLRPSTSATDGGVVQRDAGPDELHRELQAVRSRLDVLERDHAEQQQIVQQLQQLNAEVEQLRQHVANAENQQQAREQQTEASHAAVQSAVDGLYAAQQRLTGGNTSIDAELDQAQAAFTGNAQREVAAARTALQNRDLTQARALLSAAISDAQAGR